MTKTLLHLEAMDIQIEELRGQGAILWSERWRTALLKLWHGAQAVVIQYCADPEKKRNFKKVQRLKLQTSSRSPIPLDDVDDVVEAISESIYGWMKIQVEEGALDPTEELHFAIEVQRVTKQKETPSRQKIWISASFDGSAEDTYDNFEAEALSELERRQQQLLEGLQRQNDHLTVHVETLHTTLIELSTINVAPIKAVAEQMQMSNELAMTGMQATLNAAQMQFNIESVRAAEEGKSRRVEMWMKGVGQHVLPYIPSAVSSLLDRISGGSGNVKGPDMPPTAGAGEQDEWGAHLSRLKESITTEQNAAMSDVLATSQRERLEALLSARTFLEAAQHYSALIEAFDVAPDGGDANGLQEVTDALREIFDHQQQIAFYQFHVAVCEWMEKNENEENNG